VKKESIIFILAVPLIAGILFFSVSAEPSSQEESRIFLSSPGGPNVTLSVNTTTACIGEYINVTINASDEDGVDRIKLYHNYTWNGHNCSGVQNCSHSWLITLNGSEFIYGWVNDTAGNSAWTEPNSISVTFEECVVTTTTTTTSTISTTSTTSTTSTMTIPTGPTEVSGIISADTTWTVAGSPYVVTGNILIENGVTLTIEPGVEIAFNAHTKGYGFGYYIQVDGTLNAQGTPESMITFTSNADTPSPGDWGGICISGSSTIINYSIIEYGGGNDWGSGCQDAMINAGSGSPKIANSYIQYSAFDAIRSTGSPEITGNIIRNNSDRDILDWGGSIISNNVINNRIYLLGSSTTIINNTIYGGIRCDYAGNILVSNNTFILRNSILVFDDCSPKIYNNNFFILTEYTSYYIQILDGSSADVNASNNYSLVFG